MPRRSPRLIALNTRNAGSSHTPKRYLPRRSQRLRDQNKKLLTRYVKQIPTVLDNLPMNVIQYHIFPYLDYTTRNNLNMCLPTWDRVQTRIFPDSIKRHHFNYCVNVVGSMLNSLEQTQDGHSIYEGDKRIQRLIQVLSLFLKDDYFEIYKSCETFRRTFVTKIDEMEATFEIYNPIYSRIWIDEIISTCKLVRNKILTFNQEEKRASFLSVPLLKFS